jgi:monoamine oxidase
VQVDPLDAPREAKNAQKWDQISLAKWLSNHTLSKPAHALLETAISGCYTSAATEVSMLFVLYQLASGGGPGFVLGTKDASQDSRVVGGMGAIYTPIAEEIGESLHLSQPVRRIEQDADGVTVRSDQTTVRARRAVVAVPIAIASQILYEPMLSVDRSFLHQRMPSGAIFKINIVYDEPFWRNDGLSGQSAAPGSPATITIDASTDAPRPGVLCVITEGPIARQLCELDEAARRQAILKELVGRFGSKAGAPVAYIEQNCRRALLGRRDAQPRAAGGAYRVRARVACPVRPHPLGGDGNLGGHVWLGRWSRALGRARRDRSHAKRTGRSGVTVGAERGTTDT